MVISLLVDDLRRFNETGDVGLLVGVVRLSGVNVRVVVVVMKDDDDEDNVHCD